MPKKGTPPRLCLGPCARKPRPGPRWAARPGSEASTGGSLCRLCPMLSVAAAAPGGRLAARGAAPRRCSPPCAQAVVPPARTPKHAASPGGRDLRLAQRPAWRIPMTGRLNLLMQSKADRQRGAGRTLAAAILDRACRREMRRYAGTARHPWLRVTGHGILVPNTEVRHPKPARRLGRGILDESDTLSRRPKADRGILDSPTPHLTAYASARGITRRAGAMFAVLTGLVYSDDANLRTARR